MVSKEVTLHERMSLLSFCPEREDYKTLKTTKSIALKVSLTDEESEMHLEKINEDGNFRINENSLGYTVSIEFSSDEVEFITMRLTALDQAKSLTEQYMTLFEKFVL